jgi:hypothetical protein
MMKFILSRQVVGLHKALGCACGVALMFSCESKSKEEIVPTSASTVPVAELTTFLTTSTGMKAGDIVYNEAQKTFVLDGDVLITAADAQERMAASTGRTAQGEQWRWNYLVSNTYVTNIDYFINADVPADWKTATRASIANWNAVNGTKLFLREVTSSSAADVVVNLGYSADENWIARAYLPYSNGRPGNTVTINTKYNYLSASYKEFTMTHEMGHIHGLTHTNQTQGVFITGTPTTDAKSVMNATVLPWEGFTTGDITAVQTIYPQ